MSEFTDALEQACGGLPPEHAEALEAHYRLLTRWNRVINLTRVEDLREAVERHYGESLFLAAHLPAGVLRVADVGSGAGFPGLPIAVVRPECAVTLIESHQRKAVFLREASRGMKNVRVLAVRAEAVREEFDWAVTRAVKMEPMAGILSRMAAHIGVLGGGEVGRAGGVEWQEPIRLPWGEARFLWMGRRL
ncbi:MAG: 16S rRNA (guanine(527)-N(7))-methyltransferase RsmG [Bryobacteraceae bacterium]